MLLKGVTQCNDLNYKKKTTKLNSGAVKKYKFFFSYSFNFILDTNSMSMIFFIIFDSNIYCMAGVKFQIIQF